VSSPFATPLVSATPPLPESGVWIVIAAYNEGRRLEATLDGLRLLCPRIVVVDDGSADDTVDVALRHDVWVLRHIINCGQGAALQTGIDFALTHGADVIVTFDADGQHDPDEIVRLTAPILTGRADVALGSRFLGQSVGMPWSRWLVLKLGVLFTRVFSRIHVTDTHNGFRALSQTAAARIRITQNRMAHASEILDQIRSHRLSYCEVPVTIRYSSETMTKGQSSWNSLKIVGQLLLGRVIK
jgi:glycosyltransferase involved in cell wall biosynthesis